MNPEYFDTVYPSIADHIVLRQEPDDEEEDEEEDDRNEDDGDTDEGYSE